MSRVDITAEGGGLRLALVDGSAHAHLVRRLGLALPRYHFRLGRVVHAAAELGHFRVQDTLLLGNDHTGRAELTDVHADAGLGPDERRTALAALIAAAQQCLRAQPGEFGSGLVAELPGWRDAAGHSPFWQALGARFYAGDPGQAEARLGPEWRSHLAALLPRQTLYLSFLGADAQARVLDVAPTDRPLLQALREAGFNPPEHARIDDGGPVLYWPAPG